MVKTKSKQINLRQLENYQIRVSARAKYVSIKVSHLGEVEVIVPKGFDQRRIPEIIHTRQDWIAKTIQRLQAERQSVPTEPFNAPPETLMLRSLPQEWSITYRPNNDGGVRIITAPSQQLILQGSVDQDTWRQLLRQWLSQKAEQHFAPWLRQVSNEIQLPFGEVSVRGQKTLWASCSSKKNISLNYKLLFLPAPLVRYVFIHELCHTIHLDHSAKFWALVAEKERDYHQLDKALGKAWRYIPGWIER